MKMKTERHFEFSQGDIVKMIVDYMKREHQITITPKDVKVKITDSRYSDGGLGGAGYDTPGRVDANIVVVQDEKEL